MEAQLANQLLKAASIVEQKVDEELNKLDNLADNDLEEIRQKRMSELRKAQEKKQELTLHGHGRLTELTNEKDFFDASKRSPKFVCYFYDLNTEKGQAVQKALENIAAANFFTRFTKIAAEKCPFLKDRLRLRSIPVIAIVANEKVSDYIRLSDKLENGVEALEKVIEQRLFDARAIEKIRTAAKPKKPVIHRGIRGHVSDNSDSDY